MRVGDPSVAIEIACRKFLFRALPGLNHSKISVSLSISGSLVIKMKKLLDDDVDLLLQQRGGKKQS
jgi:hypothetical protein